MSNELHTKNGVAWEAEYRHRGTFSIIVTCFATLGISLWSALHLNIPRKWRSPIESLRAKLLWMLIGLFVPEILIAVAAEQFKEAIIIRDLANKRLGLVSPPPWYETLFNPHQSNDGEVKRHGTQSSDEQASSSQESQTAQITIFPRHETIGSNKRQAWTLTHGFFVVMGGFSFYDRQGNLLVLTTRAIKQLLEKEPYLVPDLSVNTIMNLSKADSLAKGLLFTQVGWFCISCLARLGQHLPLALLEVSTLTHALCALVVYILWWHKPLNVQEPIVIPDAGSVGGNQNANWHRRGNVLDIEYAKKEPSRVELAVYILIPPLYGTPHIIAWNSFFATATERLLWRVSACVVAGAPLLFFPFLWVNYRKKLRTSEGFKAVRKPLHWVLFLLFAMAYAPARLYLMAESLRQLFCLPPHAFQTTVWAEYFPHL